MALVQNRVLDKIEVVSRFKHIQCRYDNQIIDDVTGEVISKGNFDRHIVSPGDDISGEAAQIQAIASAVWTQEIIDAYAAHKVSDI